MTDKESHNDTPTEKPTKISDDNYGLLFPDLFTPTIEDKDGGKWETQNPVKGLCSGERSPDILTKSSFFPYTYPHPQLYLCV